MCFSNAILLSKSSYFFFNPIQRIHSILDFEKKPARLFFLIVNRKMKSKIEFFGFESQEKKKSLEKMCAALTALLFLGIS